jgi:hypothetical protein
MLIHAAGESSPGNLPQDTFAIALAVADEDALADLMVRLAKSGVPMAIVHEPDEPYRGQLMALGLRPARRSQLRRHLSDVPLLKDSRSRGPSEGAPQGETLVQTQPRALFPDV